MEAVIIAAGMGKRLGGLGKHTPKCLLPIGNRPLLYYQLEALKQVGIAKVTLVTGHLTGKVEAYCRNTSLVRTIYNPDFRQTGGAFSFLRGIDDIDDDVLYLICDMLYESKLLKAFHFNPNQITIGVQLRPTVAEDMKIVAEQGRVTAVGKRIPLDEAAGEFLGMAFIPKNHLTYIKKLFAQILSVPSQKKFHFGDALAALIVKGIPVGYTDLSGYLWCEIDSVRDLLYARRQWEGVVGL
jgi:choline kinase